jgi:hypothetical protein
MFSMAIIGRCQVALPNRSRYALGLLKGQFTTKTSLDVEYFDVVLCRREAAEILLAHHDRPHSLLEDNPSSG